MTRRKIADRKPGRNERWRAIMFRVSVDDSAAIDRIAKRDNCSRAEVVRTFVTWGLDVDREVKHDL
jgi:hypothetical protein